LLSQAFGTSMKCVIINETSELREKKVLINALISTEMSKTVNITKYLLP